MGIHYYEVASEDAYLSAAIDDPGRCVYGAVSWPSAEAVALDILRRVPFASVVDVGSGPGVVSLAMARAGADVIALDVDDQARRMLRRAADEQGLHVDIRAFDIYTEPLPKNAGLYVFADLLYEDALAEAVARHIQTLRGECQTCVVADPKRYGREVFCRLMPDAHFVDEKGVGICWFPGD